MFHVGQQQKPQRCEWQFRPRQTCTEPAALYDREWERWLCERHYAENEAKLRGAMSSSKLAASHAA